MKKKQKGTMENKKETRSKEAAILKERHTKEMRRKHSGEAIRKTNEEKNTDEGVSEKMKNTTKK